MSNSHQRPAAGFNSSGSSDNKKRISDLFRDEEESKKKKKTEEEDKVVKTENDDDDDVIFLDTLQGSEKRFSTPFRKDIVKQEVPELPATQQIERKPIVQALVRQVKEAPKSDAAQLSTMMSSILMHMRSQTELIKNIANIGSPPASSSSSATSSASSESPTNTMVTVTTKDFLKYLKMYINSLETTQLPDLMKLIETKIEKQANGDDIIPIEKFCLAIETMVAILST